MPQRPGRGPQDQHNVMPIAINPVRFTLLPLSSHHTERNESQNTKVNPTQCRFKFKFPALIFFSLQAKRGGN